MRPPTPLPSQLIGRVFTRAEAFALGIRDRRLGARDIERLGRGTYRHLPLADQVAASGAPSQTSSPEPAEHAALLAALCRRSAAVRVSHLSAAKLYRLRLPARWEQDSRVTLTAQGRTHQSDVDPLVVIHRMAAAPVRRRWIQGVPVTEPAELFVELARYLTRDELISLGDQLVRLPRPRLEGRSHPWCSIADLKEAVKLGKGRQGIARAREAVELVRVGADSPPETAMRLGIGRAGLPEPELQIKRDPRDPYSAEGDAGYRDRRIVLQYEGEHHFSAEQQARDQRRNAEFAHAGWTVIQVNRVDLAENFSSMLARLEMLLGNGPELT